MYIPLVFNIWWCLTHWGRVTHICVSKLTIIGSDNGLSPDRRQAIIRTNAGILLIRPLGTNFNEILIEIPTFSFTKMRLKVSSAKRRPFCLGLNVLMGKQKNFFGCCFGYFCCFYNLLRAVDVCSVLIKYRFTHITHACIKIRQCNIRSDK